jgi:hypothetical protein
MKLPVAKLFKRLMRYFVTFMFFTACDKSPPDLSLQPYFISQEERVWLTKFFKDLMLEERAVYTLLT